MSGNCATCSRGTGETTHRGEPIQNWKCQLRAYQDCDKLADRIKPDPDGVAKVQTSAIADMSTMKYIYEDMAKAGIHHVGVTHMIDLTTEQVDEIYQTALKVFEFYDKRSSYA